jgi:hypothetical protein
MSKIDQIADCMRELGAIGPSFATAVQRASTECDSREFIEDAARLLRQLSGDPSSGAIQAMRDAPRDLEATSSFLNRWRSRRQSPGFAEVLRSAEATERALQRFNAVLRSMSSSERAEAEGAALLGRSAIRALRQPRRPLLFGLGLLIFGIGVVAGIIFALVVGTGSSEFRQYFPFFIVAYAIGVVLTFFGR